MHRGWRRGGCGGGFGRRRGRDDWEGDGDWGEGSGRAFFLRRVFERLDTSPTQEREIRAVVGEVMDAGRALKNDVKGSRKDVADAFRGDDFNEELMASLLTRHDERIEDVRKAMVMGLAKIHATLDPDQRKQLARMLERGPGWGGGPYRGAYA
jgi:uncharacterized membrane protein